MSEKLTGGVEINRLIKKLTGRLIKDQEHFGLPPFCSTNPPPAVSFIQLVSSTCYLVISTSSWLTAFFRTFAQLDDDWWKTTPDTEGADEEEVPVETEQTAGADGDEAIDEENQESSPEALIVTSKGPSNSDPPAAASTSSGESSSDEHPAPTPSKNTKKRGQTGVAKVPFSRLFSTRSPITKDDKPTQGVEAAKKRKLQSSGPADAPLVISSPRKRKSPSASPPTIADSYDSGAMPSSDSNASLDLETNTG